MPSHLYDATQQFAVVVASLAPWLAVAAFVLAGIAIVLVLVRPAGVPDTAAGRRAVGAEGGAADPAALARLEKAIGALQQELAQVRAEERRTLRRLGVVRYNAFGDVGADLSFSLALLSDDGDGVVLTGLYGREETRVFSKPLRGGKSAYPLSAEEQRAIALARGESS